MTALNPFIWDRPIDDPAKIVGMEDFARDVALMLKGQTNVALFGPRDTGKTTFTAQLALELQKDHGADAPPFDVVRVNLQRALSIPAFISCLHEALAGHPDRKLQREARRRLEAVEKEVGFDLRVFKGSIKRSAVTPELTAEALNQYLTVLAQISGHVAVVFDEFQRLRACPGEPLAIIRSALMSQGSNHVSLLLTGSIRNALQMMLEDSNSPFFGEAHQLELPTISTVEFEEYLDSSFDATGKSIDEDALRHLLNLTQAHPKRTQQLAWNVWQASNSKQPIQIDAVAAAFDAVVSSSEASEFASIYQLLVDGEDRDINELRALSMLADHGDQGLSGAVLPPMYGFSNRATPVHALKRLARRGLCIERGGTWSIVDPVFAEWLRRESPLNRS